MKKSDSLITSSAMQEIRNLLGEKYPELYLAKIEIWDSEGRSKQTTIKKYKDWLKTINIKGDFNEQKIV